METLRSEVWKFHENESRGLFNKTFFLVIYGKMAVNDGILANYEQIYSQKMAVTTIPCPQIGTFSIKIPFNFEIFLS